MKKWIEKNKIFILIVFIILLIAIIGGIFFAYRNSNKNSKIQEIHTTNYSMKYDNTWKIKEQSDTNIKLYHEKSKSEFNIVITELEDEDQYKTLDEIFNSLLVNIQEQNKEYRLLNKEDLIINKNNIKGCKLLFENDSQQVEIYAYKQGTRLVVMTYEAVYDYFDLVLNSANYIIENFTLNEQKFDVISSINLETKDISFTQEKVVQDLLKDTIQEEIADNNYIVNYSLPSNFKLNPNSEETKNYEFEGLKIGKYITLNSSILESNLYEYLDKEDAVSVYRYKSRYSESNEELDKWSEDPLCYIYKNSYSGSNNKDEIVELIFEVNENHIFRVTITSMGVGIPKELVEMIKINKIENYASVDQN